jgi:hypothetical protein
MAGRYVAQLEISVIYEMINWVRKSDDPQAACLENVRAAQRFLFFHGREKFDAFTNRVQELMPTWILYSYRELSSIQETYDSWEPAYDNPFKSIASRKLTHKRQRNRCRLLLCLRMLQSITD